MAEIPVTRKSPFPFWLVPVAIVAILAVFALWLTLQPAEDLDDNDTQVQTETTTQQSLDSDLINTGAGYAGDPPSTGQAATEQAEVNVSTEVRTPARTEAVTQTAAPVRAANPAATAATAAPVARKVTPRPTAMQTAPPATIQQNINITRITDPNTFAQTSQKMQLVNKEVLLNNAPVGRVLSDRMFTVVSGNTEFFALLDPSLDSAGDREQTVQIQPGERRSFIGYFTMVPSVDVVQEQASNLPMSPEEYRELRNEKVYLHITNLTN